MHIIVRLATEKELEKLLSLYLKEGFLEDVALLKRDGPYEFSQIGKDRMIWFAEVNDEVVGVVQLILVHPNKGLANGQERAYLHHLRVAYAYHGKGIASALYKELLAEAEKRNIKEITLDLDPRNKSAQQIYEHWGFSYLKDGEEKPQIVMLKKV